MSWWNLFPCSSLIDPSFSGIRSIYENNLCVLMLMLHPSFLKAVSIMVTRFYVVAALARKFFTTGTKAFHASSSTLFIEYQIHNLWLRIWGPSKMPAFNFFLVNPGKAWHSKWSSHHLCNRDLTNCLTKSSLMYSSGRSILSLSTRGLLMAFVTLQGINSSQTDSPFVVQCWEVSLIPHRKHG